MPQITQIIIAGIFATVTIDIWANLLKWFFNVNSTNWGMVGRWLAQLPKGEIAINPGSISNKVKYEVAIGWIFHYVIGVTYAFLYFRVVSPLFENNPTLLSASLFGLITVVAPWFVMQPALGVGVCASRTPNPNKTRGLNLIVHTIFGVGLYFGWVVSLRLF